MSKKNGIKNNAQMIALMGIILAISVFVISSLAAEIANIDFIVSTGESTSLSTEFNNIKDTFGVTLNYNLIDGDGFIIGTAADPVEDESYLYGDIDNINIAFQQTRDEYFNLSFQHGIFFDASLGIYWIADDEVSIQGKNTFFYNVEITLSLDDGNSYITEDVTYLIACTPEMS